MKTSHYLSLAILILLLGACAGPIPAHGSNASELASATQVAELVYASQPSPACAAFPPPSGLAASEVHRRPHSWSHSRDLLQARPGAPRVVAACCRGVILW